VGDDAEVTNRRPDGISRCVDKEFAAATLICASVAAAPHPRSNVVIGGISSFSGCWCARQCV